jgi:hypothetical protein
MVLQLRSIFILMSIALVVNTASYSLGPTMPSDMLSFNVSGTQSPASGYLYVDPRLRLGFNQRLAYPMVLSSDGELVAYMKPESDGEFMNWQAMDSGYLSMFSGNANQPTGAYIWNDDFTSVSTINSYNPHNDSLALDGHEIWVDPDGSVWTFWRHYAYIDMSEYVPGGNQNAVVIGNDIEKWDVDGNLVWAWRSHDHIDQLPYTGTDNQSTLLQPNIDYMHLNSFQVVDDQYMLISCRAMSILAMIDMATGNVDWILGSGSLNQFTFTGNAGQHPLDFSAQHDGRMMTANTLTVFDNGTSHPTPRAYARDYTLDLNTMTAELTWYYTHTSGITAQSQGSYRRLVDGTRVIGWGGNNGTNHVTWIDENDDTRLELDFDTVGPDDAETYRAYWTAEAPVASIPYVSAIHSNGQSTAELTCNWWGHEGEVEGYAVYAGNLWNPPFYGTTDTGSLTLSGLGTTEGVVVRIRALDTDGQPVSGYSERVFLNEDQLLTLATEPIDNLVPAGGGNITYSAHLTSPFATATDNVDYWTMITLPDGTMMGPVFRTRFTLPAFADIEVNPVVQAIPGNAPAGTYLHEGYVGIYPSVVGAYDSFEFTKSGVVGSGNIDLNQWASSGFDLVLDGSTTASETLPVTFEVGKAYPNPFNAMINVAFSLPSSGQVDVRVFNVLGQQVMTQSMRGNVGFQTVTLDASQLSSGAYMMEVSGFGQQHTQRITLLK